MDTWIFVDASTDGDVPIIRKFTGTDAEVKEQFMKVVEDNREISEDFVESDVYTEDANEYTAYVDFEFFRIKIVAARLSEMVEIE